MKITWEVEDGFMSGGRPQITEVPDDEIAECDDLEEAMVLIHAYVQEDFDQRIGIVLMGGDRVEANAAELLRGVGDSP